MYFSLYLSTLIRTGHQWPGDWTPVDQLNYGEVLSVCVCVCVHKHGCVAPFYMHMTENVHHCHACDVPPLNLLLIVVLVK